MNYVSRLEAGERYEQLLNVALSVAEEHGYANIGHSDVAKAAGVSKGLVVHHLGSLDDMRSRIMDKAVSRQILSVIAEGLIRKHPRALEASDRIKKKAAHFILK